MTPPPMGLSESPCGGPPVEEASTQELSKLVIQDSSEDAARMDHFGECKEECSAEASADTFHIDAVLHEEESMEPAPQSDLGEQASESSKEPDSSKSTPHHYSLRCRHPDSICWADEDQEEGKEQEETEGEEQLTPPVSPQGSLRRSPWRSSPLWNRNHQTQFW